MKSESSQVTNRIEPQQTDRDHITASLTGESGRARFRLNYHDEAVVLEDTRSLNRWTAMGVTAPHLLRVVPEGVELDGTLIRMSDRDATTHLERMINHRTAPHVDAGETAVRIVNQPLQAGESPHFSPDSIHVTSDGFEFHVSYLTKFGEPKNEDLTNALVSFQRMGVLRPHVNIQKLGIRLVVTEWDGGTFNEIPGIEDLKSAPPQEVEALLKREMIGGSPHSTTSTADRGGETSTNPVVHLQLLKHPREPRYRLIMHRAEGGTEEGPCLIQANMAALRRRNLFQPGVEISMNTLNDTLILRHGASPTQGSNGNEMRYPLKNEEQARVAEETLNRYLADRPFTKDNRSQPQNAPVSPTPSDGSSKPEAASATTEKRKITALLTFGDNGRVKDATRTETSVPGNSNTRDDNPQAENRTAHLVAQLTRVPDESDFEQMFHSLQVQWNLSAQVNSHGFPAIEFRSTTETGSDAVLEIVLTPHHLLCLTAFGYVRFGWETRVYLDQARDFVEFPENGLRAIGTTGTDGHTSPLFIVSDSFSQFLKSPHYEEYATASAELLCAVSEIHEQTELIYPRKAVEG
ncbi:MAG: hypothetical protein K9N62_04785 [Verrucomicrobia bacterium]|nr:hypothetical protein [Verrucomicrobiota bacterium]